MLEVMVKDKGGLTQLRHHRTVICCRAQIRLAIESKGQVSTDWPMHRYNGLDRNKLFWSTTSGVFHTRVNDGRRQSCLLINTSMHSDPIAVFFNCKRNVPGRATSWVPFVCCDAWFSSSTSHVSRTASAPAKQKENKRNLKRKQPAFNEQK